MTFNINLSIIQLPHAIGLALPSYETIGASGLDLRAAIPEDQNISLFPNHRSLVPSGFILNLPKNFEAQIRPRSGISLKYGVTCLNSPGTIDSDYRGEVKILLINFGEKPFEIKRGMRIAQMVIAPVVRVTINSVNTVITTKRGNNSFGSTGNN